MNWRKPIIYFLLYLSGSGIPKNLREIKRISKLSVNDIERYQKEKLKKLLAYSYENVPYYRRVLKDAKVFQNGEVNLENFHKIPVLTKDIIRREGKNLYSKEKRRGVYENTSGGSTGEPVKFLQDKYYDDWNIANKIYYKTFADQDIGERELRLWGSERDLLEGKEKVPIRLRNYLYNRREFNSFKMGEEEMRDFVTEWNKFKPEWVEAYVQSIYEFARFIKKNNLKAYKPKGILTSAGTLYPEMQETIEGVFKTKVFNRYGSREVGDIACSCEKNEGLHISIHNQFVEIIKKKKGDDFGKILVTNLNNYAMPLIRYDIGDIGGGIKLDRCSCDRGFNLLGSVEGREMSVFKTREGKLIPGEFFIHFIGVVFNEGLVTKFQVIQKDYDRIVIKAVLKNKKGFEKSKKGIEDSIKKVMGSDCKIIWDFVKKIDSLENGKYLYTICQI